MATLRGVGGRGERCRHTKLSTRSAERGKKKKLLAQCIERLQPANFFYAWRAVDVGL